MQRILSGTAIIALTAFVLIVIMASTPFTNAAMDINGNRIVFPLPSWKYQGGTASWLSDSNTATGRYNMSNGNWNALSPVPTTAHMLWVNTVEPAGFVGETSPQQGFWYNQGFTYGGADICVAGGMVFEAISAGDVAASHHYRAIDEETGKTIWDSRELPSGDVFNFRLWQKARKDGVEGGGILLQDSSNGVFLDASTGQVAWNYTTRTYSVWIMGWNDTQLAPVQYYSAPQQGQFVDNMYGYTATSCYEFMTYDWKIETPILKWSATPEDSRVTSCEYDNKFYGQNRVQQCVTCFDRFTGKTLWEVPLVTWQNDGAAANGVFYIQGDDQYLYGFDENTGAKVFRTQYPLLAFVPQHTHCITNQMAFDQGYDGVARCWNITNGNLIWAHYIGDCPYEPYKSWYGTWPSNAIPTAGSNAFAIQTGDHVAHNPRVPGERFYVYNQSNGNLLWSFASCGSAHNGHSPVPADGMLFAHDTYTNELRGFGKGPTSVTVSVSKGQINKGEYTWITGNVMDQSAAQPGTPCVSKDDMQAWMEYLHAYMPLPTNMKGVTIELYATAQSTGKVLDLGPVTTNGDTGAFATAWVPPTEDLYTITGVFMGDDSYWTSHGSTTLAVGPQPVVSSIASGISVPSLSVVATATIVVVAIVMQKRPLRNGRRL